MNCQTVCEKSRMHLGGHIMSVKGRSEKINLQIFNTLYTYPF